MEPGPSLTIVLLGHTGVGKSASGNTILGRAAFESKPSFKSVTRTISEKNGTVFGKRISVFDTPGILGTKDQVKNCCQAVLKSGNTVLFLVVVSVGRFTAEPKQAVEASIEMLGDDGLTKSYLLFTNGDDLKNKTVEDYIFEEDKSPLQDIVTKFARRWHLFNNVSGGQEQVKELLIKSGHLHTGDQQSQLSAACGGEIRIVLLGLAEGGKSCSGNTILGSEKFKTDCGFNSVAKKTVRASAEVEGCYITVVDTPGISDEIQTQEQLFEEIKKMLDEASPGPHVCLLVIKVGRVSQADKKIFQMLRQLFGHDAHKYTMVLFTHGDNLGGQSIDEKIQSTPCVSDLVSMCSNRYCVFDNKKRKSRQVQNLMDKIHEIVRHNEGHHYTSKKFITKALRNQLYGSTESNGIPRETAQRPSQTFQRRSGYLFCCCCPSNTDSDEEQLPLLVSSG